MLHLKFYKMVKKWNNHKKGRKGGWINLISFGVSSSSYFFFSFFRKTSQMINMTMRTPRDIPTTAPATIPTSLTSVNRKEELRWVMIDKSLSLPVAYYLLIISSECCSFHFKSLNSQILVGYVHLLEVLPTPYVCTIVAKFSSQHSLKHFLLSY